MRTQGIAVVGLTLVVGLAVAGTGQATFPGANGRIAYTTEQKVIYSVEPDGSDPTRITTGTAVADPTYSPDGKTLALVSKQSGGAASTLVTVDAAGGDLEVVPGAKPASDPSFSASGERIAYESKGSIKTVDLDGGHKKTVAGTVVGTPEFSPAGPKILYVAEGLHNSRNIFLIDADGRHTKQLTNLDKGWTGSPAYSPDGKQIVFTVQNRETEIWVMTAGGAHEHAITDTPGVADGVIETMDAAGGTPVAVTDGSEDVSDPSWQALP